MTTATLTNFDIAQDALRKLGVVAQDEAPTADEIQVALRQLDRMLKGWQSRGYMLWTVTSMVVPLTTAASYVLDPVRPVQIQSIRLRRGGIDTPMMEMNRDDYDSLPQKNSTGLPTQWYYDRQRETGTLYIWPVLAAATGEELRVTYVRELEDVLPDAEVDVPSEWWDAVVYNLAARLSDDYSVDVPNVIALAQIELRNAMAGDREGSVSFVGEGYY
jgi:hypothetical protein